MPLPMPLKVSEQAIVIKTALEQWAVPRGGRVAIMANQRHILEELADLPQAAANQSPRLLVLCVGEDLRLSEQPDCHRVDRRWHIVIVMGRGFYVDPMSGGPKQPFTDSVEQVRDILRCLIGISDEEELPSVRYRGWKPLSSILPTREANAFADAVVVEVQTANDIPEIILQAPGTEELGGDQLLP